VGGTGVFVGTAVGGTTVGVAFGAVVAVFVGSTPVLVGLAALSVAGTGDVGVGGMAWVGLKTAVIVRFGVGKTKGVGVTETGKLQAAKPGTRSKAEKRIFTAFLFMSLPS
jgi:hypothetical protein